MINLKKSMGEMQFSNDSQVNTYLSYLGKLGVTKFGVGDSAFNFGGTIDSLLDDIVDKGVGQNLIQQGNIETKSLMAVLRTGNRSVLTLPDPQNNVMRFLHTLEENRLPSAYLELISTHLKLNKPIPLDVLNTGNKVVECEAGKLIDELKRFMTHAVQSEVVTLVTKLMCLLDISMKNNTATERKLTSTSQTYSSFKMNANLPSTTNVVNKSDKRRHALTHIMNELQVGGYLTRPDLLLFTTDEEIDVAFDILYPHNSAEKVDSPILKKKVLGCMNYGLGVFNELARLNQQGDLKKIIVGSLLGMGDGREFQPILFGEVGFKNDLTLFDSIKATNPQLAKILVMTYAKYVLGYPAMAEYMLDYKNIRIANGSDRSTYINLKLGLPLDSQLAKEILSLL